MKRWAAPKLSPNAARSAGVWVEAHPQRVLPLLQHRHLVGRGVGGLVVGRGEQLDHGDLGLARRRLDHQGGVGRVVGGKPRPGQELRRWAGADDALGPVGEVDRLAEPLLQGQGVACRPHRPWVRRCRTGRTGRRGTRSSRALAGRAAAGVASWAAAGASRPAGGEPRRRRARPRPGCRPGGGRGGGRRRVWRCGRSGSRSRKSLLSVSIRVRSRRHSNGSSAALAGRGAWRSCRRVWWPYVRSVLGVSGSVTSPGQHGGGFPMDGIDQVGDHCRGRHQHPRKPRLGH